VNESIGDAVAIFGANKFGTTIKANYPGVGFNFFYNGGSYTLKAGYAGLMEMNTNTGDIYFGGFNFNQSVTDFGPITGYKQILTMKQSGNVGIGVDNPVAQLDVQKSNIGAIALVNFKGTSNYSHFMYGANEDTYIRGGKNGSNVIINDITAGKTGVSTSTPLTTFHVKMLYTVSPDGLMLERDVNNKWITGVDFANDYSFYIFNGATYPYRGYIDHVSGTYNSLSDKNLKTDIQPLDNNFGLSMLMQLNPVRYHFLDGNRQKFDYGFISQEVEKVNPDFVTNKDGVKMLGYTEFIPVTVKAVQEQQQQIEELRKEVETLKKLILSKN
jgi:hypothetical protein